MVQISWSDSLHISEVDMKPLNNLDFSASLKAPLHPTIYKVGKLKKARDHHNGCHLLTVVQISLKFHMLPYNVPSFTNIY